MPEATHSNIQRTINILRGVLATDDQPAWLVECLEESIKLLKEVEQPPALERPCADCGKAQALYQISYCLDCLHKRYPREAKKLAAWGAMNKQA